MDSKRPVLFGEVLFDCFPEGETVLGGAPFNVAWHLQGFGLSPLLISRVGDDPLGHRVKATMQRHGMDTSGLQLDSSHPTGKVNIVFSGNDHSFEIIPDQAYDFIDRQALPPLPEQALFYHGSLAARNPVSANTLEHLRTRFREHRLVDVNLRSPWWEKQSVLALLKDAWIAKLNDEELLLLTADAEDDEARINTLMNAVGLQGLLLTRGAAGAELVTCTGDRHPVTPKGATRIVDTVGAGDALTSVFILAMLQDWPYQLALERAQTFASAIVGRRGATVEDRAFFQPFIDQWELI